MRPSMGLAALTAVVALVAGGCGYDATPVPEAAPEPAYEPADPPTCETTDSDLASYDPADADPSSGKVDEIRERGRLIVGVSADTYLMGYRNPENNRIEGFDIDFARAIGAAIFPNFNAGRDLHIRVINSGQRIELLENGELDLVIRNFTVNCARWETIAFSQVYYEATQKVLVRKELDDGDEDNGEYHGLEDLAGKKVCAPNPSTSLDNIQERQPEAELVPAGNHTGCLVKFQRGEVDAITGDDTVLAGLAAQDPSAVVPEQQPISEEPYGIGANADDEDLVAFVNSVLEDMRNGTWQRSYRKWLRPHLGVDATQPRPVTPYRS
ncbi:glutamate ABC transporter substrate-binding protein [Nocardioides sp. TF02-7]|uniref:glutamate ABC transporter substrate-binding protein n=1 Tax=Nocardioides sp. TF02-7 TaxID=2917724 RepID=UPI001F06F183|nr:glutamate ABC transporter substrate-binding protein [Nocardioides sp. TF02-7]UMG93107.1 glutamate ABC transporter substrate-binding protein [Nocardioides sp. TF02-7]